MKKNYRNRKMIIFALLSSFLINLPALADKTEEASQNSIDIKGSIIRTEVKTEITRKSWLIQDNLTGDWNGIRPWLEERGITLEGEYMSDGFVKARGGLYNGKPARALGKVITSVNLDTEKAGMWNGGNAFVSFENLHGRGLSENYVGDIQIFSNIDAQPYSQLNEYFVEQNMFKNTAKLKFGKQDANADFCMLENATHYIHSSFGLIPTVPMPTYPAPAMGVAVFAKLTDKLDVKYGLFDSKAKTDTSGVKTTYDGVEGSVHIAEISYQAQIKKHSGKYIAGYWRNSADIEEITTAENPDIFSGNHGFYTALEQSIYSENNEDDQGLNMLSQFGWAPGDRTEICRYYSLGLIYKGLLPKKDRDITGLGVAIADISNRYKEIDGRSYETALELFHKINLTPWLILQPDMQYIINPGGAGKNSLVFGIRTIVRI